MGNPLRGSVLPSTVEKSHTGVLLPVWIMAGKALVKVPGLRDV